MPEQNFITIDIGSAWTKAFFVAIDTDNRVNVAASHRLPTSWGDFSVATNLLLDKISQREVPKIFVSHIPEVEALAKKQGGQFIAEEIAASALAKFLKKSDNHVSVIDGGASNLSEGLQSEEIGKFLTFPASAIFLENYLGKKKFKPQILPANTKELEIEEAFLRSSLSNKLFNLNTDKKILIAATGGTISGAPRLSRIALLILDILPSGAVVQVVFDREFFLPSFGALLSKYKQLQIGSSGGWLEDLGVFVSLGGGKRIELDWGYSQIQQVELTVGEISLIPVPPDQKIKLSTAHDKRKKKSYHVHGGSLGIVVDAREKPLPLVFGQGTSRQQMGDWLKDIEQAEINKEAF